MYIFLDIDGVLVREGVDEGEDELIADLCQLDEPCRECFEDVVRKYSGVKIVISSSWREIFDLDRIRAAFSADIGERIEGATPLYANTEETAFFRYNEVTEYLSRRNASDEPWIAIDDIAEHYPDTVRMVVTDPFVGFDAQASMKLDAFLNAAAHDRAESDEE